jgi:hypothetical protein
MSPIWRFSALQSVWEALISAPHLRQASQIARRQPPLSWALGTQDRPLKRIDSCRSDFAR